MQSNSILKIFNEQVTRPVNREFVLDVVTYAKGIARKHDRMRNHIDFLGGNLIGVYPFIMINEDLFIWKNEVMQFTDFDKLQSDIYDLPDITRGFKVSSDAVNISFLYLVHKALTSDLPEKEKVLMSEAAIMALQYKLLSSLHTRRFPYPADEGISQMVYESLDNKSQLKQYGSWLAMLTARAESILGHDALHATIIRELTPDRGIVLALNDIQTRLRSLVQGLTNKYYAIKDSQSKLITTSKFTIVEGEAILKDTTNAQAHIKNLMEHIVPDKNNFIKDDIMDAVIITIKTAHKLHLSKTLEFISENYTVKNKGHIKFDIEELIDEILMFCLLLIKKENIHLSNVPEVAMKLKGVLGSSRFKSPEFLDIKEKMDIIVEESNPRIHENAVTSTRIAAIFYICLRGLLAK
jgi:hypothetical protein